MKYTKAQLEKWNQECSNGFRMDLDNHPVSRRTWKALASYTAGWPGHKIMEEAQAHMPELKKIRSSLLRQFKGGRTMKSSFAVTYRLFVREEREVILGVTSICPNLNGILFFTEDGENHQIENYQMNGGWVTLGIDYDQDDYLNHGDDEYHIHDHRNK